MKEIKELIGNIAGLFKVKTIVTLAVTYVLCESALGIEIPAEAFMGIVGTVYGYYFGTKNAEARYEEMIKNEKIKAMVTEETN